MTIEEIEGRVNDLRLMVETNTNDEETWHQVEDKIWEDVLRDIADPISNITTVRPKARAALKTREIGHSRWYA